MPRPSSTSPRLPTDLAMTQSEPGDHNLAQASNPVQIHVDHQEIYTIDSEQDEEVTGDTERSKALLSHNNPAPVGEDNYDIKTSKMWP